MNQGCWVGRWELLEDWNRRVLSCSRVWDEGMEKKREFQIIDAAVQNEQESVDIFVLSS